MAIARGFSNSIRAFFRTESSGGVLLVFAALIALISANSPWSAGYLNFWHEYEVFINDGLIAIFFFLVGLEIRQEARSGQFRDPKSAALPIVAAIGGMVTPALIFVIFNSGSATSNGWAIPMATDIALALGALALLGKRIDTSLKVFLLTLAIADDLGSILVLGIFYSHGVSLIKIASSIGAVILAWIIPLRGGFNTEKLIKIIHPWSAFLVIPLFALVNIGIQINLPNIDQMLTTPVVIGRVVGKVVGITFFAWAAVKLGFAKLPAALSFKEIAGAGALAGMGLTVSLFVAKVALTDQSAIAEVKFALLLSALISAVLGLTLLRIFSTKQD
ncbi:MAG: Na+/H+ antiporter NhaA [Actinobacteria bacterium]|nr:Na+/H+ antiporter NhaA [Actinomycetota bacterium]